MIILIYNNDQNQIFGIIKTTIILYKHFVNPEKFNEKTYPVFIQFQLGKYGKSSNTIILTHNF